MEITLKKEEIIAIVNYLGTKPGNEVLGMMNFLNGKLQIAAIQEQLLQKQAEQTPVVEPSNEG